MAIWPTGVASDSNLYIAKNNLSTTLVGAIDAVTTSLTVADASAFPAVGFLTIGTEAISYTSWTGNVPNGVVRGADGTVAASHLNGTAVNHYAVAAHHNAPKDEIIAIETQLAAEMAATKEPTGFPDASTTTISVVDGTRTFTIAPTGASFDVYVAGKKYTKTSESVVFADTEGVWFFYYDASGVLTASQTVWDFALAAPVSLLYWNATDNVSLDLADERHGSAMDWATHQYLHTTVGTRFVDGLAASGYVLNSAVDADVRFAFSAGHISDEDLRITIAAQTEPAQIPVFFRAGAGGLWKRATATDYPYLTTGTGRIAYNLDTAGTWSQAEVTSGDFTAYWIFATDGKNYPIIAIQGQRSDTSLVNALTNQTYESLAFGTFPYAEMKLLFRVLVRTSNAYGSTMKVRIVDVQDLRSVSNLPSGSYVATDHGSLSGRTAAGSHPASAISNTPAGTIAATDVQAAIDELDTEKQAALGFTPENVANKSTDGTLAANSTTLYPSQSAVKTYADTKQTSLGFTPVNKAGDTMTGSLGIGIAPTVKLHVADSSATCMLMLENTTANTKWEIQNNTDGNLHINANGVAADVMRVDSVGAVANTLYLGAGKVGIGTASPATALEIVTNDTSPTLHLYRTGTFSGTDQVGSLSFGYAGDSLASVAVFRDGANDAGALTLGTQPTGGGITERLRIGSSGLVTAPGVYSNTDASAANVYVDSSGNLKRSTASAGGSGTVNSGTAGYAAYYASTGTAVSETPALQIASDKVGVGLSPTSAKLHIYNTVNGYGAAIQADQANTLDSCKMLFQAYDDADKSNALVISANNDGNGGSTIYTTTNTSTKNLYLKLQAYSGASLTINSTTNQIATGAAGSASVPQFVLNSDANTGIWAPAADTWAVSTNGVERLRIDSAGRSSFGGVAATNYPLESYKYDSTTNLVRTAAGFYAKSTGTTSAGHGVAINFGAQMSDGTVYSIGDLKFELTNVSSRTSDIHLSSYQSGSYTERLRLIGSNGYLRVLGVYGQTTASAANVYVDSSGNIMRSTSSLRYKTAVAEVAQDEAAKLLDLTPVTYASLCEGDNKEERHYGFIAEELDLIDPTLVNYKTLEDGTKVPDGVQYERVVVGLLKLVQDLTARVKALEETPEAPQE
jgi:hypothetical protein